MANMTVSITFDADKLIDDVMSNYPEYSSPSLSCYGWKYKECVYLFEDREEDTQYKLTRVELRKGLEVMFNLMAAGELPGIARNVMPDFQNAGNWDMDAADALVQCAIFGEVRYG